MCNASDRMQLSSNKETGWNEWTIAQVAATADSRDTIKEERKEKEKEQEKAYYLEWS